VPVIFAPAQNSVPASDVVEKIDLILAELGLAMIDGIQQLVEVLFFDDLDFDEIGILCHVGGFVFFAHEGLPMFPEEFDSLRVGAALEVHVFAFV